MFGGYYSNPLFGRSHDFVPHGAMSAIVTRDTVATNSYSGNPPQYPPLDVLPVEENETVERYTEKATELIPPQYIPPEAPVEPQQPVELDAPLPSQPEIQAPQEELLSPPVIPAEEPLPVDVALAEEVSTEVVTVTKAAKRAPKKKPVRPPPAQIDEDEEDEQGLSALWPFAGGKGSVPSYNAFFPISISGGAPVRTRAQGQEQGLEDYVPGSATAIANSFSTGKGGIATSHATSFGDPYLASLVRNGLLSFRSKKPQES
ncbi:uncharacterized protein LOC111692901 [Anoplophora glabripennis]|uniref:uncharacterized protein LOC111692901 n=1 Tax=Anoplophora glabripennis TaxID=217634 RepID=UPI000C7785E8|nr:uncharacterized protein LOC111692901 [Anoplophora glabripennis]